MSIIEELSKEAIRTMAEAIDNEIIAFLIQEGYTLKRNEEDVKRVRQELEDENKEIRFIITSKRKWNWLKFKFETDKMFIFLTILPIGVNHKKVQRKANKLYRKYGEEVKQKIKDIKW